MYFMDSKESLGISICISAVVRNNYYGIALANLYIKQLSP